MSVNEELVRELRRLVAEEVAREPEASDDPFDAEYELEVLGELAQQVGDCVFSLDWDSGGPGAGAGTENVYRIAGKYLYLSNTYGWTGPFETLDDAYGSIFVSAATQSIHCSEWSEEEIIRRIQLYGGPAVLYINGTAWPFETLEHTHARMGAAT
jgi:hypothetical protein